MLILAIQSGRCNKKLKNILSRVETTTSKCWGFFDMIGYIYKLTSPNGKVYIGQTINLKRRFGEYDRHKSRNGSVKINNSLNKYGIINFKKEILFEGECTIQFLNELEIFYIKKYDSVKSGLNLQYGGLNGLHSEETKIKMRDSAKKLMLNKDYALNRNAHWKGRKHSTESKDKMSKKRRGRKLTDEWKKNISKFLFKRGGKLVLNMETGIYYNSIRECADSAKMNYSTLKNRLNGSKKNTTIFRMV